MPGNESEGKGVSARVNSTPRCARSASAEYGCSFTYQARSDWWRPSTDRSSTCLKAGLPVCPAALLPPADAAHIPTSAAVIATNKKRLIMSLPVEFLACRDRDDHGVRGRGG